MSSINSRLQGRNKKLGWRGYKILVNTENFRNLTFTAISRSLYLVGMTCSTQIYGINPFISRVYVNERLPTGCI